MNSTSPGSHRATEGMDGGSGCQELAISWVACVPAVGAHHVCQPRSEAGNRGVGQGGYGPHKREVHAARWGHQGSSPSCPLPDKAHKVATGTGRPSSPGWNGCGGAVGVAGHAQPNKARGLVGVKLRPAPAEVCTVRSVACNALRLSTHGRTSGYK
jgi:hypothetical protein